MYRNKDIAPALRFARMYVPSRFLELGKTERHDHGARVSYRVEEIDFSTKW